MHGFQLFSVRIFVFIVVLSVPFQVSNRNIFRIFTGNPHVPPSLIVAKLVERLQMSDERNSKILDVINDNRPSSAPPTPGINPHGHETVE